MKKVVVTGGAGFIGSHLAEELARRDYRRCYGYPGDQSPSADPLRPLSFWAQSV